MSNRSFPSYRILIAECVHEICSFNPVPTRYDDFFVNTGEQILAYHRGIGSEVSGAMRVFGERAEITVVPTFSARGITSNPCLMARKHGSDCPRILTRTILSSPITRCQT